MVEYTTKVLTHGALGYHKGKMNRQQFESALAEMGSEGWDLAWVFMDMPLLQEKDGHVLLFKRLKNASALEAVR